MCVKHQDLVFSALWVFLSPTESLSICPKSDSSSLLPYSQEPWTRVMGCRHTFTRLHIHLQEKVMALFAIHENRKTSSQQWRAVEGASWFVSSFLPLDLDSLSSRKLIPNFIKVSHRVMSGWLFTSWSSIKIGWCSRTETLDIDVNLLQSDFRNTKSAFWNRPEKVKTRHPKNMSVLKLFWEEESPPKCCTGRIPSYNRYLLEVIAAKSGLATY